jgi:hypothetical protein
MVSETSNNTPKDLAVIPVPPTKPPPGSHSRTTPNAAVSSADRPDVLLQAPVQVNRESEHDQTFNSFNTSNSTQSSLPTTAVPPTKRVPDSYSHILATAPFIPAAHPDVLLQASQDFADNLLQQDLHGTTPFPPPPPLFPLLHLYSLYMAVLYMYSLCDCTSLMYCTHKIVMHSRHSLTHSLTHHVLHFLCM